VGYHWLEWIVCCAIAGCPHGSASGYRSDPSDDKIIPCPRLQRNSNRLALKLAHAKSPRRNRNARFPIDSVLSGTFAPTSLGKIYSRRTFRKRIIVTALRRSNFKLLKYNVCLGGGCALRELPLNHLPSSIPKHPVFQAAREIMLFCRRWQFINGEFVLQQFFMRDPVGRTALLERLGDFSRLRKRWYVHGKAFDAPLS